MSSSKHLSKNYLASKAENLLGEVIPDEARN
jgi:hypothetical protein